MTKQLNMNDKNNAYTIVSLVFFLPYALFQPPATVAIREIGPRRFLATIVFFWGAVMIVSNWWLGSNLWRAMLTFSSLLDL